MQTPPLPNMPGAGAMSDSLEFVKNLWGSMGVPGMSTAGLAAPSLSPEDLDKKIADLKAVESWLNVNMTMLRGTIQALEVQRTTLATLKSMSANFAQAMGQMGQPPAAAGAPGAAPPPPAADAAAAMLPAANAWWNLLQDQFKQAVSSTMAADAKPAAAPAAQPEAPQPAAPAPAQQAGAPAARAARPKADKT